MAGTAADRVHRQPHPLLQCARDCLCKVVILEFDVLFALVFVYVCVCVLDAAVFKTEIHFVVFFPASEKEPP